ncbi:MULTISPECIES: UvrD-helicase domain-containing protein [Streptomyces]|uniref:UvrD-like helicase ATP-binding domain-containing protein n=1 Tax=Streptomyces pseudovenezuelae TaxID=67350 RepID=A0A124H997_9ACTN|nr:MULTISPECIES: UvrD-helicase domain-containing protein [Streptomyces]KUM84276.1 hypothetical protein AQI94_32265 [Streptomyces pseudovenezuelae]
MLLDEAQDTNPVLEEIFLAQDAQRVCVGDPAQQIYEWRHAKDIMSGLPGQRLELRSHSGSARPSRRWRTGGCGYGPAWSETAANAYERHRAG